MIIFESSSTKAAFYFAAEEYIMRFLRPSEAALMLWSTDDTVMLGANQVADAEHDSAFAKANGITLVRRASGGGAIYTDRGTLQITIILPYHEGDDTKNFARDWIAAPLIETIVCFGAGSALEGRNDIVIDGCKISGFAQYIRDGYICSHGSLLFDADLDKMSRVLAADPEKFVSKGISSVAARVTNITSHIAEHDMYEFREALMGSFEREGTLLHRTFGADELEKIESIMRERYDNPDWTYGREPAYTRKSKKRFPGGSLEISLDVKGGVILSARITGDFLALQPVEPLEAALVNIPYREDEIRRALSGVDVKACLGSLGEPELIEALLA